MLDLLNHIARTFLVHIVHQKVHFRTRGRFVVFEFVEVDQNRSFVRDSLRNCREEGILQRCEVSSTVSGEERWWVE